MNRMSHTLKRIGLNGIPQRVAIASFLGLFAGVAGTAAADPVEALNFANGNGYMATYNNLENFNVGWSFTVNSPITVSSLGYFDGNALGLNESHAVTLYKSDGTVLTSATVVTGDPLVASTGSQPGNG